MSEILQLQASHVKSFIKFVYSNFRMATSLFFDAHTLQLKKVLVDERSED